MIKKLIVSTFIISLFIVDYIFSYKVKSYIFAISLATKDIILFALPFLIFFCVLNAFLKLGKNAFKLVFLIISTIFISNFSIGMLVYPIGIVAAKTIGSNEVINIHAIDTLNPAFETGIDPLFSTFNALVMASIVTIILIYTLSEKINFIREKLEISIKYTMNKFIVPIVPVFIYGFALKIIHEKILIVLIQKLSLVFVIYLTSMILFMLTIYFIVYQKKLFINSLKEMIPTWIVALTTVSSNVSMPFLLKSIKNTIGDNEIIDAVVPTSINFHLLGDCFLVNIFIMYIYAMYNDGNIIYLYPFIIMNFYIALSRFMGVAIPGGGAFVVAPILESQFGFTSDMTGLFTTIYILLDFINTCANVSGNGCYTALISRMYYKFIAKKSLSIK